MSNKETKNVRIKYIDKTLPKLELTERGDMVDLYVSGDYDMAYGKTITVKFGVAMELPEGYEAHIYPRSSTYTNHSLLLTNSVGVIDNSYKGDTDEWMGKFLCFKKGKLEHGSRIAQFRIVKNQPELVFTETDSLGNEDRGGYGTSGI